jgi:hypothetical protein
MADWNYSDYQSVADALWVKADKSLGTAGVVAMKKNGNQDQAGGTHFQQYADGTLASVAYDALVNAPGDYWYLALYDEVKSLDSSGRVDETYLGGVAVQTPVKRPVAAIVATATALGLAIFAGRKKRRK